MSANATELYTVMERAITCGAHVRKSEDSQSPAQGETVEAMPFQQFVLGDIAQNVPAQLPLNVPWAVANVLHFFAATERAEPLKRYNKAAERFAPDGVWIGAYGAIAVPQLRKCVEQLTRSPNSRRAFVSMGEMLPQDINRPACWNMIHFLNVYGALHAHVYQRSLHLTRVMRYDCILLTNVLNWMAYKLGARCGYLHWTVGSLHQERYQLLNHAGTCCTSMLLPPDVLDDSARCWQWLEGCAPTPWWEKLC